jgi:predicted DNA-binding transcriptional regulator AlpA
VPRSLGTRDRDGTLRPPDTPYDEELIMGSITVQFDDATDREALINLLSEAITRAIQGSHEQLRAAPIDRATVLTAGPVAKAEPESELIHIKTVAAMLGVSPRMVYRLNDGGRMPRPVSIGRMKRWRRADIVEWIRDGCPRVEQRGVPVRRRR